MTVRTSASESINTQRLSWKGRFGSIATPQLTLNYFHNYLPKTSEQLELQLISSANTTYLSTLHPAMNDSQMHISIPVSESLPESSDAKMIQGLIAKIDRIEEELADTVCELLAAEISRDQLLQVNARLMELEQKRSSAQLFSGRASIESCSSDNSDKSQVKIDHNNLILNMGGAAKEESRIKRYPVRFSDDPPIILGEEQPHLAGKQDYNQYEQEDLDSGHGVLASEKNVVSKLTPSKGWKPRTFGDNDKPETRKIRSLLNKLTPEKFQKLQQQILGVNMNTGDLDTLRMVVEAIFKRVLLEPDFAWMYAELTARIEASVKRHTENDKDNEKGNGQTSTTFRRLMIDQVRHQFNADFGDSSQRPNGTDGAEANKGKKRCIANICFIGELFIRGFLADSVIHKCCIQPLLNRSMEWDEMALEATCRILQKAGENLAENPRAAPYIETYFSVLAHFNNDKNLKARVRFMIRDLIEQKRNRWKQYQSEEIAETPWEIQKEVEGERPKGNARLIGDMQMVEGAERQEREGHFACDRREDRRCRQTRWRPRRIASAFFNAPTALFKTRGRSPISEAPTK